MSHTDIHIRCQRCGNEMELRDPGPGMPWTPDQFWVCSNCGRHFWTTYPPPAPPKPAAPEPPKEAAPKAAAPKAAEPPAS